MAKIKNTLTAGLSIIGIIVILFSCTSGSRHDKKEGSALADTSGLVLPDGFSAVVVADNLGRCRHIAVNENNDVYIALDNLKDGFGTVALRDTTDDGVADIIQYFGKYHGTGLHIHKGYLYFGADTIVVRYKLAANLLAPAGEPEVIAYGFPNERQHAAKSLAFDNAGNMYVNVGGPANACMEEMRTPGSPGKDPCPLLEFSAGIWKFKDDVTNQRQMKEGYRYATGLRNCVAVEWNTTVNKLYVVQHGRDQLYQFFPEYYTEDDGINLPSEEFFLVEEGDDFGWPYCYYDHYKNKKLLAPEYGGDGEITGRCESKKDPIMAFPAHIAPNDLIFYTGAQFPEKYKNGALIAFHGSWNRNPQEQEGFYIVFVPFENGLPSGDWEVFADGFKGKDMVMSPGEAEYRPMGLAVGPDGSLFVSDSQKGRVWKISYNL
ncbi:MAG: PQQ-dependent sugar dehydrogenase [Bacteroidales bacterium]|nr:PQQ-dependent sugar dehydrogenase [Bacteroidales bacterium]